MYLAPPVFSALFIWKKRTQLKNLFGNISFNIHESASKKNFNISFEAVCYEYFSIKCKKRERGHSSQKVMFNSKNGRGAKYSEYGKHI